LRTALGAVPGSVRNIIHVAHLLFLSIVFPFGECCASGRRDQ